MVTVEEEEEPKREFPSFAEIDWERDAGWKDYLRKFDLGMAKNVEVEENRLRVKWYRKTYDSNFTPYKTSSGGSAAGGNTSGEAPASNGTNAAPGSSTAAAKGSASSSTSGRAANSPSNKNFILLGNLWSMINGLIFMASMALYTMRIMRISWKVPAIFARQSIIGSLITFNLCIMSEPIAFPNVSFSIASWRTNYKHYLSLLSGFFNDIFIRSDAQYILYCMLLMSGQNPPPWIGMAPLLIISTYQSVSLVREPISKMKLLGFMKRPVDALFSRLQRHLPSLLLFNAASEVAYAIVCGTLALFSLGKKMSFLHTICAVQILKLRYHSMKDGGAMRHRQVWNGIALRVNPYLNRIPILQRPVSFIKRWFTLSDI